MNNCRNRFDSPNHRLVEQYMQTTRLHRIVLERALSKTGVYRSQHQILMHIADKPNASQKEIAKMLHVTTATIAVSLKKLEKGGYIKRVVDQDDNRFNQICITEKGSKIVEGSVSYFMQVEEKLLEGFNQKEKDYLHSCFKRMTQNLESLLPEKEGEDKG